MSRSIAPARSRRGALRAMSLVLAVLASLITFASTAGAVDEPSGEEECYVEVEVKMYRWKRDFGGEKQVKGWEYVDGEGWVEADADTWYTIPKHLNPPGLGQVARTGTVNLNLYQGPNKVVPYQYPDEGTDWWPSEDGWAPSLEGASGLGWVQVAGPTTFTEKGDTFPCPTADAAPGTCEAPGEITASSSEHYETTIEDGKVTFTPTGNAVFPDGLQTEYDFTDLIAQLTAEECDDTPPPPPPPPGGSTTTTTTTEPPETTTTTEGPAVGGIETEADPGVASGGAILPRTGDDLGGLVLAGMLMLGAGAVMRRTGRWAR
jgi:LPXTG-motif cell wall-anchored protein